MATYNKFHSFVEAMAEKKHNLGSDQITIALTLVAPVNTNTVLSNLTEVAYDHCSARDVTTVSSAQTSGTYALTLQDITLTASGGAVAEFRYIVLYNDTAANDELIGWYDYGSGITLADGESLAIDFAEPTITITE